MASSDECSDAEQPATRRARCDEDGFAHPSDSRITWRREGGTFETAKREIQALVDKPQAEVAQIKIGFSTNPRWRMTGLPDNPDCTMEPHYLRWGQMIVLYSSSDSLTAARMEQRLISAFEDYDKLTNEKSGGDGPVDVEGDAFVYALYNDIDQCSAFPLALARARTRPIFCVSCRSLELKLENHKFQIFATACACNYRRRTVADMVSLRRPTWSTASKTNVR